VPVAERAAGSIAVRLSSGADQLADIVRALDAAGVAVAHLALHEPTLDDVFLAKTGRSLEGAGQPGAEAAPPTRERAAA
jgi:ABC-2 type transport system ATP-binding protein